MPKAQSLVCAVLVLAATTTIIPLSASTQSAPATTRAAAAAPVKDEDAALAAVRSFFDQMLEGDDKGAAALLYFSKPDNQKTAETMFSQIAASQRLRRAVVAEFGNDATLTVGMDDKELADVKKGIAAAKVTLKDHQADVSVDTLSTVYVVVKGADGAWKVDFEATQKRMGELPPAEIVASMKKQTDGYDALVADMKGDADKRKYKTLAAVKAQIAKIDKDAMADVAGGGLDATRDHPPATLPK